VVAKRSEDESLDNIARFFEHVASELKENQGVFFDDDLTVSESVMIFRICKEQARKFRAEAQQLRESVREKDAE
jgi:cell division protein ZapA (FtsZ GTPase activity inhibitor)